MTTKRTWKQQARVLITPGLIITIGGLIITGITMLFNVIVEQKEIMIQQKQLQFETPEQRIKTKVHFNTPYNPVNAYKQSIELTEQTIKIDTALAIIERMTKEKAIDKERIDKSRAARDSVNILILKKLQKLDSI